MQSLSHRLIGLDFVRAVAILLVITSHFGHTSFDALGFFGVEMFFALSGFLIGNILWRGFQSSNWSFAHIRNFWYRRWWRTLPNYYLFLILIICFASYTNDNIPQLPMLSSFFWFGQSLMSHSWGFYNVSWSLCIEEWFYLLFPIIIFCLVKLGLSKTKSFACGLLIILILTVLIKVDLLYAGRKDSLRYITFARLDAIAYGVGISFFLSIRNVSIQSKVVLFISGLFFISFPLWFYLITHKDWLLLEQNPILLSLVPLGFSCTLPLVSLMKFESSFVCKVINKLSLWSYSAYLSHLSIMWVIYSTMIGIRDNTLGNLFSKISALIITFIISSVIYNNFETYFTRLRPKELE